MITLASGISQKEAGCPWDRLPLFTRWYIHDKGKVATWDASAIKLA